MEIHWPKTQENKKKSSLFFVQIFAVYCTMWVGSPHATAAAIARHAAPAAPPGGTKWPPLGRSNINFEPLSFYDNEYGLD